MTTDNEVTNFVFDETRNYTPRYLTNSFVCPSPMSTEIQRKSFPNIYKFGAYAFLNYLPSESHSPNALEPWSLEFIRSTDLFTTSETMKVKCINDGGVMREIIPNTDGFFPVQISMVEANGKIYGVIAAFEITTLPPTLGTQWSNYKTYIVYSEDLGETWSEMLEIDPDYTIAPSAKPIVVGNEIWYTGYNTGNALDGLTIADLHSYILKYNYLTDVTTRVQMDSSWTGLATTEPAILEYATGKYIGISRVNWNDNFPGAESSNKGMVIAYSTDGDDWTNYEFLNWGGQFPNQPKLFMYKGHVYIFNNNVMYHGVPSIDESEIEWVVKAEYTDWRLRHGYVMMAYEAASGGSIYRKDPRVGYEDNEITLTRVGGLDMCVWDEDTETLISTIGYHNDQVGVYLAEPWVGIIKRNQVKEDELLTKRLLFMTEIPSGDNITIHNSYIESNDTIKCAWADSENNSISINGTRISDQKIKFTSGSEVTQSRIVYEIIKS